MLLSDRDIRDYVSSGRLFVDPFHGEQIRTVERDGIPAPLISFGTSCAGLDFSLGCNFKVTPDHLLGVPLDVKKVSKDDFKDVHVPVGRTFLLRVGGFVLAEVGETIHMPRDLLGVVVGKSTYARMGLVVNTTPMEPGWRGRLTIELTNTMDRPLHLHVGEGIAQVLFLRTSSECEKAYGDRDGGRGGKYQDQTGVTIPRM